MKYITLIISIIICFSCSSDDQTPTIEPNEPNSKPGTIKIDDIVLDGPKVTINWSDAEDKDGDQIFYKLYVNSILITETTESISSTVFAYNEDYVGRIIGTDKKGGTTEVLFKFSSSKSKILLYTGFGGTLYALDLYTLKPMWKTETSFIESHVISDNLIYSGINGLDILSGKTNWTSKPTNKKIDEYRSIIVDVANIYALDSGSTLYCIDKITGGKLWQRNLPHHYAPLSIDSDKIFTCSSIVSAINKQTGAIIWNFKLEKNAYKTYTNPLVVNNDIFFGDNSGRFYSLNKNTGIKNWSIDSESEISFYASPTQFKESIITATYRGIYAYNLKTVTTIWEYNPLTLNSSIETSPFIYNDKVYIGVSKNGSGELLCLNANDGSLIWRFDLDNNTTSSPIVFDDTVYIGDWSKNMYAINAETGILNWKKKHTEIIIKSPIIIIGEGEKVIYPSVNGLKN
ncbi:PQQ-binding-like beta-propeller repeat protein [Tenacibaculum piscium]|uniref:PQQ-binding-like beta-propeller repeat protein n=1 Tax=Tenacibaculum piscium TaxID=1458515 RepID=UPI001F203F8E|nr:PQQ-binding-like beta-propeller repeat protein [Tenacibaculum piscium]